MPHVPRFLRTDGLAGACVVRNRELVLQQILTVSNYEYDTLEHVETCGLTSVQCRYVLAFIFNQAGELHYEVRATGVLSTAPIDPDVTVPAWGTVVHDGVLAPCHQHILSLRIDPAIGGYDMGNRLAYSECHALPMDANNPHGNGYVSRTTTLDEPGGFDLDASKNRVFMIQNAFLKNEVNELPISYKIQVPPMQKILAHPDSFPFQRAEFADHSIYLTRYNSDELFSGGKYTNQSRRPWLHNFAR